jgi:hypothetical protein
MKALIERQLYRPGLLLPMMGLVRLLVSSDYNLTQVGFIIFLRGSRYAFAFIFGAWVRIPVATLNSLTQTTVKTVKRITAIKVKVAKADKTVGAERGSKLASLLTGTLPRGKRNPKQGASATEGCHCGC